MSCSITLNTRITSENTTGYFVFLGYHTATQVDNTVNVPSDNGDLAFGIEDALDLGTNSETASDGIVLNNPYTVSNPSSLIKFSALPYSQNIDFDGFTAGFYGFMYITGDPLFTGDVNIALANCGDIEAFEIEVLDAVPTYNNISLTYCQDTIPGSINLTTLLLVSNPAIPAGVTYMWLLATAIPLGTLNAATGAVTAIASPAVGQYVYTITLMVDEVTHPILGGCCEQETANVTINILPEVTAGTGSTLTVCN